MTQTELKPCPFCGGNARVIRQQQVFESTRFFVACMKCGIETPRNFRTSEKAREAWNRRADHEQRKSLD